jgi:polar amino acid transport system substrate-binding protein
VTARRRRLLVLCACTLVLGLTACSNDPAAEEAGAAPTTTTSTTPPGPAPGCTPENVTASYAPLGPQPTPGQMPGGTTMREIQDRGRLVVAVSGDLPLFGSLDPADNQLEGFDIDIAKAVGRAIFGEDGHVTYKVVSFAQRIPDLQARNVDMVADIMTITCTRWSLINFSTEYFTAGQQILVARGSDVDSKEDLAGRRACAADRSTSASLLEDLAKAGIAVVPVIVPAVSDCMVEFQSGTIDAIVGDNTVVEGFASQDPYAEIVGGELLTTEPYGLGFNQEDVDLTRFVNGVLEEMRQNGEWAAIWERWLAEPGESAPAPPPAVYGRALQ